MKRDVHSVWMRREDREMGLTKMLPALRFLVVISRRRRLFCVGLAVLMACLSTLSMWSRISLYGQGAMRPSGGDAILWLFMGNSLGLTPEWGALWCIVLVAGGVDIDAVLAGGGCRHAVACGDRRAFWRSLCLSAAASVLAILTVFLGSMFALAVALGGCATLSPVCIDSVSLGSIEAGVTAVDTAIFLLSISAGAVAFSLLETALLLVVARPWSLVVCVAGLLGSAFLPLAPLPGSWLMATRLDVFTTATTVTSVWPVATGLCLFVATGVLSYMLGGRIFERMEFGVARPGQQIINWQERAARPAFRLPLAYCVFVGLRPLVLALSLDALVTGAQCIDLFSRVSLYAPMGARPCLADFLAYAFLGSRQPDPFTVTVGAARFISIPFGWLVLALLPLVWTFLFSVSMRRREIAEALCGSREAMWLSRCAVAVGAVTAICLVELAMCFVAMIAAGGTGAVEVSAWFPDVAGLPRETLPEVCEGLGAFVASYCATNLALVLAQLALSEFAGPLSALVVLVAVLTGSIFAMTPVFLGNFLMAARSAVFVVSWQVEVQEGVLQAGLESLCGIRFAAVLGVLACLAGLWRAKAKEFYGGAGR